MFKKFKVMLRKIQTKLSALILDFCYTLLLNIPLIKLLLMQNKFSLKKINYLKINTHKLCILSLYSFGVLSNVDDVF